MKTMSARMIHVTIEKPWKEVYAFARAPENLPQWASGLATGISREGEEWIVDGGPIGQVRVRFAADNEFGIIDHTVTMEDGSSVFNPLRVMPNGNGAELIFTLFWHAGLDAEGFEADAAHVLKDLQTLKTLVEGNK
ncbi:SRPBCC family protein [Rhizobium deserti]|uniref:SRPBCC family protein n=2 Tax=Rhizobium deserti TaxID=2547961 RepID=A0A4R5ULK4_9HYPH|nr:SRPBCC family protein [Rhizobium deserti]TDK38691.1 SRPBCC family protein [Rhizobium deserti]